MSSSQPNVLFLFSDEHNAKCLGHAERSRVKTPNLDRLAGEGVRFSRAISQNPICTPSRICFASGQYCHNHGYYGLAYSQDSPRLVDNIPHIYGNFKRAGYRVGAVGKSHLPPRWIEDSCDRLVHHKGDEKGYPAFLRDHNIPIEKSATLSWNEMSRDRFSHDFGPDNLPYEQSMEHWQAREAIDFLEQHGNQDDPFFLQVGFQRPHTPCTPSPRFWDMYPEENLTLPPNTHGEIEDKPPFLQKVREQREEMPPEKFRTEPRTYRGALRRYLRGYYGCISQMDHAIGKILDYLERNDLAENTIVIYSSDHGDYAIEHGITEKAPGICSDAVCRIPFICRWPGRFPAAQKSTHLVESVDLAPTLCALADLPSMPTADGHDITRLLEGKNQPVRDIAVTENPLSRSIRTRRYRMVHYPPEMEQGQHRGDLYDMKDDPWETNNLFQDPEYGDVVQDLQRRFINWLTSTTRVVSTHPPVDSDGSLYSNAPNYHRVDDDGKRGLPYLRQVRDQENNYL